MAGKQTFQPSKLKSKQDVEREALRLALWVMSILHRDAMLHLENRMFGDGYSTVEGIMELLMPLFAHSGILREIKFLFDPSKGLNRYTDPREIRREIRRLENYSRALSSRNRN